MADNLTPEQRRKTMAAVKGKNTSLEICVDSMFRKAGWRYERNVADLPGKPDFVFRENRLIVFVDGDFWHGWQFPKWRSKLSDYWQRKIDRNRRRDGRNFKTLRRHGWRVIRFWEHHLKQSPERIIERVRVELNAN